MQAEQKASPLPGVGTVIDIGGSNVDAFRNMLEENLIGNNGKQEHLLPSAMMGDDIGLHLWSRITYAPEYYQTRDEIELLEHHGSEIAKHIVAGCTLIDLGSG